MARYAKALPYAAIDDLIDYPFQFGEMIRLSAVTHVPVTALNGDVPWVIYCPCSKLATKYLNSDNQVCRFQCSCQCHDAFTLLHLFITVTHTGAIRHCGGLMGEAGMLAGLCAGMDTCYGSCYTHTQVCRCRLVAATAQVQACLQACWESGFAVN
jgi:hypothetical protein